MLYYWTVAVTSLAECYVSMKRIEDFLLQPENQPPNERINYAFEPDIFRSELSVKPPPPSPPPDQVNMNESAQNACIVFQNVCAKWNGDGDQSGLRDISLEIHKNQLVVVDGPVGCGKSSILLVILRELKIHSGKLTVNGRISYAAQEPWLFDATVRQNIIFTEEFDDERYREVIRVCCLETDLQSLAAGDLTIVGESGICLSGGQKARINLARAIYRKADIYLLDDPLSAVDSAVGKHIFQKCIKNFLNDKICLLVTHQEQHLLAADQVIYVCNGRARLHLRNSNAERSDHNLNENGSDVGPEERLNEQRLKEKRPNEVENNDLFENNDSLNILVAHFFP